MGRRAEHTAAELRRMALDAARSIVSDQGLRALTTRAVAKAIGYTGGTLYQLFDSFDELVEEMNAETIDDFRARCERVDLTRGPSASLRDLAEQYEIFTREHPKLWSAIFEQKLQAGYRRKETYDASVRRMLAVVESAIAPLFRPGQERARLHDVRVLWAWLYGVSALASGGRMHEDESVSDMVQTVIDIYVSARSGGSKDSPLQAAAGDRRAGKAATSGLRGR